MKGAHVVMYAEGMSSNTLNVRMSSRWISEGGWGKVARGVSLDLRFAWKIVMHIGADIATNQIGQMYFYYESFLWTDVTLCDTFVASLDRRHTYQIVIVYGIPFP